VQADSFSFWGSICHVNSEYLVIACEPDALNHCSAGMELHVLRTQNGTQYEYDKGVGLQQELLILPALPTPIQHRKARRLVCDMKARSIHIRQGASLASQMNFQQGIPAH
jgi:hypothetical protein